MSTVEVSRAGWLSRVALLMISTAGCIPNAYHAGSTSQALARPTQAFPVAWNEPGVPPAPPAPAQQTAEVAEHREPAPERTAPNEAGVVAVMPVNAREAHLDSATLFAFDEAIRTVTGEALTPAGYTVLTSETTLTVLRDNGIDPTKACEASCALDAARELKAKLFVSATIAQTEGQFVAFVRLFENKAGKQLGAVELDGSSVRELRKTFAEKAPELFARVLNAPQ